MAIPLVIVLVPREQVRVARGRAERLDQVVELDRLHRMTAPGRAQEPGLVGHQVSASTHHCSTRVTWTVAWKVLSVGFCFRATTAMGRLPDESPVGWILIRAAGENKLATRYAMDRSPPLWNRVASRSVEAASLVCME